MAFARFFRLAAGSSSRWLERAFYPYAVFLQTVPTGFAAQAADSPIAALEGPWSGNGTITMANGTRERIRCDGQYRLASRTNVQIQLNCASDSYRFQLRGDAVANDRSLAGTWSEASRGVAGKIYGRINGNRLEIRADGQTFSALLSMTTRGSRQTISIRSPGSEMSDVSISLSRRSR